MLRRGIGDIPWNNLDDDDDDDIPWDNLEPGTHLQLGKSDLIRSLIRHQTVIKAQEEIKNTFRIKPTYLNRPPEMCAGIGSSLRSLPTNPSHSNVIFQSLILPPVLLGFTN